MLNQPASRFGRTKGPWSTCKPPLAGGLESVKPSTGNTGPHAATAANKPIRKSSRLSSCAGPITRVHQLAGNPSSLLTVPIPNSHSLYFPAIPFLDTLVTIVLAAFSRGCCLFLSLHQSQPRVGLLHQREDRTCCRPPCFNRPEQQHSASPSLKLFYPTLRCAFSPKNPTDYFLILSKKFLRRALSQQYLGFHLLSSLILHCR